MNVKMLMIAFAGILALLLIFLSRLVPVIIVSNMIHKSRCVLMIICLNITLNMVQSCLYLNSYFYRLENKLFSHASYVYDYVNFGKVLFTGNGCMVFFKYDITIVIYLHVLSITTICNNTTGNNVTLPRASFRTTLLIMPMLVKEI